MKKVPWISRSWDEGRIWDHWMIVHFLSSTAVACALEALNFGRIHAYLIAIALLVAWELGERIGRVDEEPENLMLDIVFGMLGFAALEHFVLSNLNQTQDGLAFLITLVFAGVGALLGWIEYRKRNKKE